MLREKILNYLRHLHFAEGHLWRAPQYLNGFYVNLSIDEQKEFNKTMIALCEDGIFTSEVGIQLPSYRLTAKGEEIIYK